MQGERERATAGGMSGRPWPARMPPAWRDAVAAGVRGGRCLSCGIPLVPLSPGESRLCLASHVVPRTERLPASCACARGRATQSVTALRDAAQGRGFSSVGPPASFQAPKPPAMWATGVSPMVCAACVASAERMPPAQKKTNFLPLAKKGL